MQYKILLHGESVASNPSPADLHESVEALQATLDKWGNEGWTFPGANIQELMQEGPEYRSSYRLTGGDNSPALLAVRTNA